jgi:hypothetical protein
MVSTGSLTKTVAEIICLVLLLEVSFLATSVTVAQADRIVARAEAAAELAQVLSWSDRPEDPTVAEQQRLARISISEWRREADGGVVIEVAIEPTGMTVWLRRER